MADLDDSTFTPVNDIEVSAEAPLTEALFIKLGGNDNNLNTRVTANESNIATNTSDIAARAQVESLVTGPTAVGTTFTTIITFSQPINEATVTATDLGSNYTTTAVVKSGTVTSLIETRSAAAALTVDFQISGSTLQMRRQPGSSFSSVTAYGIGFF